MQLLGELEGGLAVPGLTDHVVALLLEHLAQIQANNRFIFGNEDSGAR
jgi:hypothetical protein